MQLKLWTLQLRNVDGHPGKSWLHLNVVNPSINHPQVTRFWDFASQVTGKSPGWPKSPFVGIEVCDSLMLILQSNKSLILKNPWFFWWIIDLLIICWLAGCLATNPGLHWMVCGRLLFQHWTRSSCLSLKSTLCCSRYYWTVVRLRSCQWYLVRSYAWLHQPEYDRGEILGSPWRL